MIRSRKQARANRIIRSKELLSANRRIRANARSIWLELPPEVMSMILLKLDAIQILTSVQYVCSSWYKICKEPHMWRVIDMHILGDPDSYDEKYNLEIMCMHAVYRSRGQLVDINLKIGSSATDNLLRYITCRTKQLRRLRMVECYNISNKGLTKAISKLPPLEHLEIFLSCSLNVRTLRTIGQCYPLLKSLKLNEQLWKGRRVASDKRAFAIAETMPMLRHLQICGNGLSDRGLQAILDGCPDRGLQAILDGCPDLESLDLRQCFNLNLAGQLRQKCAQRIKVLQLPHDPIVGCEFTTEFMKFPDYAGFWVSDIDDPDYNDFLRAHVSGYESNLYDQYPHFYY